MKRCLMITWLFGALCIANNGAAGNPLMVSSPYGLSSVGRVMSQGFRTTYGGQIFGARTGTGQSGFPYSDYGRQRAVGSQVTSFALVELPSYVVEASSVTSDFGNDLPNPAPGSQAISTGSNSSIANAPVAAAPLARPGQVSVASPTNTAASGTPGLNSAAGAFWNSAYDPRLRRLFRWSEGHVLIIVEDASPFMLPISDSPANYGDAFDASLVVQVKQILSKKGYYGGPMDGVIGPSLHRAIQDYQRAHKLDITGGLDAPFLQSLGMLDNASEIDDSSIPAKGD